MLSHWIKSWVAVGVAESESCFSVAIKVKNSAAVSRDERIEASNMSLPLTSTSADGAVQFSSGVNINQ